MTNEELTAIYNEANGLDPKRHNPITTERIFTAMRAVARRETQACWDDINAWIKPGELAGNGCDQTAQRNGMILASNILMERMERSNCELTGEGERG